MRFLSDEKVTLARDLLELYESYCEICKPLEPKDLSLHGFMHYLKYELQKVNHL